MQAEDLAERIVEFARLLRKSGVRVSTAEAIDALEAALLAGRPGSERFRLALRSAMAKRLEDLAVFDHLYARFWAPSTPWSLPTPRSAVRVVFESPPESPTDYFMGVYSPVEALWEDLGFKPRRDPRLERLYARGLKTLRRAIPLYEGRRRRPSKGGGVDFRRTLRRSLRTFGEAIRIARSSRKLSKSRVTLVLDVSNSMREHWLELYSLAAALKTLPAGSYELFLFSTRLSRATGLVHEARGPREFFEAAARALKVWRSGTRIGEALDSLVTNYPWAVGGRSIVLVVSDGWDLGDLVLLESSLESIARSSGALIWAVPGVEEASPSTVCLRVAEPLLDHLIPLDLLKNPKGLASRLARTPRPGEG